jgi:hypothetical protein
MLRIYAAYGASMTMNRTGRSLASMTKAKDIARRMSFTYPACEIRELTAKGTEILRTTFVGGHELGQ